MALVSIAARRDTRLIRPMDPAVEDHRDVIHVPNNAQTGRAWGVFDHAGRLVPSTGFYRGTDHHLVMQEPVSNLDLSAVEDEAPDDLYIYGGALHPHYGHFLLSTLSRFWSIARNGRGGAKILMSLGGDPQQWFTHAHIRFCLGQLGLAPDDFAWFDRPTRLRRLLVPLPSFEEEHFAHSAFRELAHQIGQPYAAAPADRSDVPVYLSKARMTSGVWRFANEATVSDVLEAHGVEIVYPEQLTMPEQIRLLTSRSVICGSLGSALHSHIFAAHPPRIVAFNRDATVLSNFTLLDMLNDAQASYFHLAEGFTVDAATPGFSLTCLLNNPIGVAEDLLRLIDRPTKGPTTVPPSAPAIDPESSLDATGLRNGTDKSSACHNFLVFYERFFSDLRALPALKLLEIGVYDGGSLRTWEEYFPNATIIGADIDPRTLQSASPRITIEVIDQSNVVHLTRLATTHGPFDIVIDDGSHRWDHQITSLRTLLPFVKPGGYYVVEDIDTSYGSYVNDYGVPGTMPAAKYLHELCDYVVGDAAIAPAQVDDAFIRSYAPEIEFVAFYRRTAIIRRKAA